MIAVQVAYADVPAEISQVSAYEWRPGSRPVPLAVAVARTGAATVIALDASAPVFLQFARADGRYLLDGPFTPAAPRIERHLDRTWRLTVSGRTDRPVYTGAAITWLSTTGTGGDLWPACWWLTSETWECGGVPSGGGGVVVVQSGSALWSSVVTGSAGVLLRRSAWGRLLAIRDRGADPLPQVRLVPAHPVLPSAQRVAGVRLETARMPDVRVSRVSAGVFWVAGDLSPPDAWIEVRTSRSGPAFLSLPDVADGSPVAPLEVALDDTRKVRVSVVSESGTPIAGAVLTTFRMIDPVAVRRSSEDKPPRRVFAAEQATGAEGVVEVEVGDASYEFVAWHPQLGKASAVLDRGASDVTLRLRSPGLARGRVLVGGRPAADVSVVAVPDPSAYAAASDPLDVKGGDARTAADGRFAIALAPSGGGELRVGGGSYAVTRVPLPPAPVPLLELGDIQLGRPHTLSVVLDQDPGCDLRAAGPVGRTGLQIVVGRRTAPGLFDLTVPEEGTWELGLVCGRNERSVTPAVVRVTGGNARQEVQLTVR